MIPARVLLKGGLTVNLTPKFLFHAIQDNFSYYDDVDRHRCKRANQYQ